MEHRRPVFSALVAVCLIPSAIVPARATSPLQLALAAGGDIGDIAIARTRIEQWRKELASSQWKPDASVRYYRDGSPEYMMLSPCAPLRTMGMNSVDVVYSPKSDGKNTEISRYRGGAGMGCKPKGVGEISFPDGSQWVGEVETITWSLGSRMLPAPNGLGEFRAADGSIKVGYAKAQKDDGEWDWSFDRVLADIAGTAAPQTATVAASPAIDAGRAVPASGNALDIIETWRAQLAPGTFVPQHEVVYTSDIRADKQVKQCGGKLNRQYSLPPTPFRINFAYFKLPDGKAFPMQSFEGFGHACTLVPPERTDGYVELFAAAVPQPTFGLITYTNGSYWLGQVKHIRGGDVFVPAPDGIGELTGTGGTRVQGTITQSGGDPDMAIQRAITADGGIVTGERLWFQDKKLWVSKAVIRWPNKRFEGSIVDGNPVTGAMVFADGTQIAGNLSAGEDGVLRWKGPLQVKTVAETTIGPPGIYETFTHGQPSDAWVFGVPLRAEWLKQGYPQGAATLAKPTRNDKGCSPLLTVPAGWVVWWPECKPGPDGMTVAYSADGRQKLWQYFKAGAPSNMQLLLPNGRQIVADSFTADANPAPIGEARMYIKDGSELAFEGSFDGQGPDIGYCAVPSDEGGGLEPCEHRSGHRIDQAHQMRRERLAMKRQQEELLNERRRLEQEAERERRAAAEEQRAWEEEQARLARQAEEDDEPRVDAAQLWAQGIADAFQHAANVKVNEARQQVESSQRRRAAMDAMLEQQRARTAQIQQAETARQQRAAQLQEQQDTLQRRQEELRRQQASAASRSSMPSLTVEQASPDYYDTSERAARNEDTRKRMWEENERRLMKMKVTYMADGRACYAHPELQSPELQAKLDDKGCTSPGKSGPAGASQQ